MIVFRQEKGGQLMGKKCMPLESFFLSGKEWLLRNPISGFSDLYPMAFTRELEKSDDLGQGHMPF